MLGLLQCVFVLRIAQFQMKEQATSFSSGSASGRNKINEHQDDSNEFQSDFQIGKLFYANGFT